MTARALKPTWVTRRLPTDLALSWGAPHDPQVADLLLCEVVRTALHGRVETTSGSRMKLYAGDQIICAVGNRYATALLEAVAEAATARIDLLSASGVCGRVLERAHTTNRPTSLQVLGQAFSAGHPVNLRSFSLGSPPLAAGDPSWVVVVGSAMDSGKTTACASLIHGLTAAGLRVGAAKLTGTASARDFGAFRDAGAAPVLDFLDVGWPSTMGCTTEDLRGILQAIAGHLRAAPLDWAVLEIADGLLQPETARLLEMLRSELGSATVVLTARESLAAVAGIERLGRGGLRVAAVSGVVTNSPLACREVELACSTPCVPTRELGRRLARGPLAERLPQAEGEEEDEDMDSEALGAASL